MIQRFLLLSAFVVFSSIIVDPPRSLAATNDPASIVGDLGGHAISVLQNVDTAAAKQEQFRQLFRQYFDVEACARFALGTYWPTATTLQRQEFVELYEDYVVVSYSTALRALGGASFGVLGSQSDREGVIVSSRVQINGGAPIRIDWRLNPTNHGYKVTDVIVNGSARPARSTPTWSQSSSVTTGTCRPSWLPCAKKMRATVSFDSRRGFVQP
jgi:phospholipid transport system substrate-binding protein